MANLNMARYNRQKFLWRENKTHCPNRAAVGNRASQPTQETDVIYSVDYIHNLNKPFRGNIDHCGTPVGPQDSNSTHLNGFGPLYCGGRNQVLVEDGGGRGKQWVRICYTNMACYMCKQIHLLTGPPQEVSFTSHIYTTYFCVSTLTLALELLIYT